MNQQKPEKNYTYKNPSAKKNAARRRRIRRNRIFAAIIAVLLVIAAVAVAGKLKENKGGDGNKKPSASTSASSVASAKTEKPVSSEKTEQPEPTPEEPEEPEEPEIDFEPDWDTTGRDGYPYLLAVNRVGNTVTVFEKDDEGNYTVPCKAMVCSSGRDTPVGTFTTSDQYDWRLLAGYVYGQYATRITSDILFHSVPYFTANKNDIEYEEFNKLGTAASLGCIRLQVVDCKWIYDECPKGTTVVLYDDAEVPGPLGQPSFEPIDVESENRGWDPTDPDPANPWHS